MLTQLCGQLFLFDMFPFKKLDNFNNARSILIENLIIRTRYPKHLLVGLVSRCYL